MSEEKTICDWAVTRGWCQYVRCSVCRLLTEREEKLSEEDAKVAFEQHVIDVT